MSFTVISALWSVIILLSVISVMVFEKKEVFISSVLSSSVCFALSSLNIRLYFQALIFIILFIIYFVIQLINYNKQDTCIVSYTDKNNNYILVYYNDKIFNAVCPDKENVVSGQVLYISGISDNSITVSKYKSSINQSKFT